MNEKIKRNSKVEFIQGNISSQEIINKISLIDVVFCSGVLYHIPEPLRFLHNLRMMCREILILATMTIPEMSRIKNVAIFYPFLDEKQRNIWNLGVEQRAISKPYRSEDTYANWFWGFSPSCVESMLKCAGFEIIERYIRLFQTFFVCRTTSSQLAEIYKR